MLFMGGGADRVYELVMGEIKRKRAQRDFMRSEGLDRYSEMYEEVAVALQTVLDSYSKSLE